MISPLSREDNACAVVKLVNGDDACEVAVSLDEEHFY